MDLTYYHFLRSIQKNCQKGKNPQTWLLELQTANAVEKSEMICVKNYFSDAIFCIILYYKKTLLWDIPYRCNEQRKWSPFRFVPPMK